MSFSCDMIGTRTTILAVTNKICIYVIQIFKSTSRFKKNNQRGACSIQQYLKIQWLRLTMQPARGRNLSHKKRKLGQKI